jgi:RNA polymerase sigma factor (sigma-70 family)
MERAVFIRACREGGSLVERALRSLHQEYGPALLREAWLVLRDMDSARDQLQETLLAAWRHCLSYRGDAEVYAWLKQVLRHGAISRLRTQRPESALTDDDGRPLPEVEAALRATRAGTADEPQAQAEQGQREATFRRCFARFAAEHPQAAEVIRWITEDDLAPADIAALLQRSPGATREFIFQCRKKARHYLADWHRLVAGDGAAS